jgi:hypothetical protein
MVAPSAIKCDISLPSFILDEKYLHLLKNLRKH